MKYASLSKVILFCFSIFLSSQTYGIQKSCQDHFAERFPGYDVDFISKVKSGTTIGMIKGSRAFKDALRLTIAKMIEQTGWFPEDEVGKLSEGIAQMMNNNIDDSAKKVTEQDIRSILEESMSNDKNFLIVAMAAARSKHGPFLKVQERVAKIVTNYIAEGLSIPNLAIVADRMGLPKVTLLAMYGELPSDDKIFGILDRHSNDFKKARSKLYMAYKKASRKIGRTLESDVITDRPGTDWDFLRQQLTGPLVSVDQIEFASIIGEGRLFENLQEIKTYAYRSTPDYFAKRIIDIKHFPESEMADLVQHWRESEAMLVTSSFVIDGKEVHPSEGALKALIAQAKARGNAPIVILAVEARYKGQEALRDAINKLAGEDGPRAYVLTHPLILNETLAIYPSDRSWRSTKPVTGKAQKVGPRGMRVILPGVSQSTAPVHIEGVDDYPFAHSIHTTGAITKKGIGTTQLRDSDRAAMEDWVIGGMIIEKEQQTTIPGVEVSGNLHTRHFEYSEELGGIRDLNLLYQSSGAVVQVKNGVCVLGDLHLGENNELATSMIVELVMQMGCKALVLHDIFNGHSVSGHEKDLHILLAKKAKEGTLDINKELAMNVSFLNALAAQLPEEVLIHIVPANHNDWLTRLVDNINNNSSVAPHNRNAFIEIQNARANGINGEYFEDAYHYGLFGRDRKRGFAAIDPQFANRIIYGRRDQQITYGTDVNFNAHGDQGKGGARGSFPQFLTTFDAAIVGHSHTRWRLNRHIQVGTFMDRPDYAKGGPSAYSIDMVFGDSNGWQLIERSSNNGLFFRPQNSEIDPATFYPAGGQFPHYLPPLNWGESEEPEDTGLVLRAEDY